MASFSVENSSAPPTLVPQVSASSSSFPLHLLYLVPNLGSCLKANAREFSLRTPEFLLVQGGESPPHEGKLAMANTCLLLLSISKCWEFFSEMSWLQSISQVWAWVWLSMNSAACFQLVKEPFQIHRPDQRLGAGNQGMGAVTPQLAGEGTLVFHLCFAECQMCTCFL